MVSGIYCIKVNNELYIGSSINVDRRKNQHIKALVKNRHYNNKLQNS